MTNHDLSRKALAAFLSAVLSIPAGLAPAFAAEPSAPASLRGVTVEDDMVTIKLSTSVMYNSFLTKSPPRLVMELLDTKHEGPSSSAKGKGKFLASVRTSQFGRTPRLVTRVVMDLVKMAGYKISVDPAGLTVQVIGSVEDDAASTAAAAAAASQPAPAPAPKPAPRPASVRPVRPVRAIVAAAPVPAPMPAAEPVVDAVADAVVAAAPVAAAPAPVQVAAPVAAAAPELTRPKIKLGDAGAAMRRAGLDKTMNRELAAAAQDSDVTKTKIDIADDSGDSDRAERRSGSRIFRDIMSRMPRDPVTLDFDNTDIRDVIRLLGAKAKINIVFGPDVTGSLTLHLSEVPFNEAFRTALSMMKLTTDQVGDNILRVITPAELIKQRTTSSATTRVFVLNYAKAADVKITIDAVRGAEGRNGSSTADVKTNALIVTDTLEGLLSAENLVLQLDQRPRQVLIEAKLVEINANSGLNYGVQWDYVSSERGSIAGKKGTSLIGSTIHPLSDDSPTQTPMDLNANAIPGLGAAGRGTGVNLSADRIFGALTVGRITNNFILNATLTAAASEGKAKVLSEPKISTLNNQAANINVTTQIPYVTSNVASTGVQTQSVSYVTTGIKMLVTPSINSDGRITLLINPDVSQPSVTASGSTSTGAPAVDARSAMTTVLVRDGETIVIGGLINDSFQDSISKIPLLGDIPILGWLFKKKTKIRVRSELLIFVTTRILPD